MTLDALLADGNGVSPELSQPSVHLAPDRKGNLPLHALVPFCSYQGKLLGQPMPEIGNLTACDKFKETILEGQHCFSLDVSKIGKTETKSGISNGILLLLDPNSYQVKTENDAGVQAQLKEDQSVKINIHTLAPHSMLGPGYYAMSSLKKMTGTESFEQLPDSKKKCIVHNREECQTRKYLNLVQKECGCTPWTLHSNQDKNQVKVKVLN